MDTKSHQNRYSNDSNDVRNILGLPAPSLASPNYSPTHYIWIIYAHMNTLVHSLTHKHIHIQKYWHLRPSPSQHPCPWGPAVHEVKLICYSLWCLPHWQSGNAGERTIKYRTEKIQYQCFSYQEQSFAFISTFPARLRVWCVVFAHRPHQCVRVRVFNQHAESYTECKVSVSGISPF